MHLQEGPSDTIDELNLSDHCHNVVEQYLKHLYGFEYYEDRAVHWFHHHVALYFLAKKYSNTTLEHLALEAAITELMGDLGDRNLMDDDIGAVREVYTNTDEGHPLRSGIMEVLGDSLLYLLEEWTDELEQLFRDCPAFAMELLESRASK